MGKEVDPSDVGKHQDIIKKAQAEMARSDVLVCGQCHNVYHFIEEFIEHRNTGGCSLESTLRENRETKPKVWAFLLWKAAQRNDAASDSWKLYQQWVKLDEAIRETWIVAGRTIQSFARMGQGNLQEMPVKITKTVVDTADLADAKKQPILRAPPAKVQPNAVQIRTPVTKPIVRTSATSAPTVGSTNTTPPIRPTVTKMPSNASSAAAAAAAAARNVPRVAIKSTPDSDETESAVIEKILAKRFNPRRREHEYLIKWEKFAHEQNTWEPQSHLAGTVQLLETFEKQLARQKQQRAEMAAKAAAEAEKAKLLQQNANAANQLLNQSAGSADPVLASPTRLPRTSKAKAMDQVKQWCQDNEEEAKKRKLDDSDYENTDLSQHGQDDHHNTSAEQVQPPAAKVARRDALGGGVISPAQAMIRAGQTGGGVKIVPVSKTGSPLTTTISTAQVQQPPKLNGLPSKAAVERAAAEAMIAQNVKQTGIIKKPGVTASLGTSTTPKPAEAQIRVVQKGDSTTSGVVRIASVISNATTVVAGGAAIGPAIATGGGGAPTVMRRVVQPQQQQSQQQLTQQQQQPRTVGTTIKSVGTVGQTGSTIIRQTTNINRQPVGNTKALIAARAPPSNSPNMRTSGGGTQTPQGTTVVTRTIVPGGQQQQSQQQRQQQQHVQPRTSLSPGGQTVGSKAVISRVTKSGPIRQNQQSPLVTQEDKLAALQRHGDLKITRKQLPANTTIKQVKTEVVDSPAPFVQQPPAQQVAEISLCPVTGQVLTHDASGNLIASTMVQDQPLVKQEQQQPQQQLQQQIHQQQLLQQQQQLQDQQQQQQQAIMAEVPANLGPAGEIQQMMVNDDGSPILVTGEDGTVYQVAGKNEQGQTILIAQGGDGEQQCVYVTSDDSELNGLMGQPQQQQHVDAHDANTLMATMNAAHLEAEQQQQVQQQEQQQDQQQQLLADQQHVDLQQQQQFVIKQDHTETAAAAAAETDVTQPLAIATDSDSQDGQITAEVVQADLPSPGGTRRVVLLLPDGSFMMTEVSDEQYQALNLVA